MRAGAGIVGALALLGLVLQCVDVWQERLAQPTLAGVLWYVARYFTILTNALVAGTFLGIAAGRPARAGWLGGVLLWILITGIVYHLLLSGGQETRLGAWADLILHTLSPLAVTLWWLVFAPRRGLTLPVGALWLLWPALYCGYALARGMQDGLFPYFFIDPARVGWTGVLAWIGILLVAFASGALALLGLARLLPRTAGERR